VAKTLKGEMEIRIAEGNESGSGPVWPPKRCPCPARDRWRKTDNNRDNNLEERRRTEPVSGTLVEARIEIETDSSGRYWTAFRRPEKPGVGGSIPPLGMRS